MNIRRKFIIMSLIFSLLLSTSVYASDVDNTSEVDLSSKTFDELLEDMNSDSNNLNIYYALELKEKIKTVSPDRIVEELLDKNNNSELRVMLISCCDDENIDIDSAKIKHLLFDGNETFRLKNFILMYFFSYDEDIETLVQVAEGEEEQLAFHAIKYLRMIDFPKAVEIADDILADYNGPAGFKARAAIAVRAVELAENSTQEEIMDFIQLCDRLLYDEYEDDPIFSDAIGFDLSGMHKKECAEYILHCDKMSYGAKWNAANENGDIVNVVFGDVNLDNQINAADALDMLKYAADLKELDTYQVFVAEVDGDEVITAADALMVLKNASKMIDGFPVM